jgi:peroxiredoxin
MQKLHITIAILAVSLSTALHAQELPVNAEDIAPLLVGETFPNTELTAMDGSAVPFLDIVKEKPTVLVVYRGGWCPYCNRHLSALGQNEAAILELGYQVVAVSPDKIENLQEAAEKDSINYRLFSDGSGAFSKAVGIAFQAPERYEKRLLDWSGGENTARYLPVPSVFVLNTDGEIQFEYINPNYKKRLSGEMLLAVLKALNEAAE